MGRFFVKKRVSPSAREIAGQARNEGVASSQAVNGGQPGGKRLGRCE